METIIYLIRHGETDWNKERRFQGQKDILLNNFGRLQTEKLANRLYEEKLNIDAIYSSDLKRAIETAEIIGKKFNYAVETNPGLRERSFGIIEGQLLEDWEKQYPDFNFYSMNIDPSFRIEEFDLFKSRVYTTILELSKRNINKNIIVVSHGAAINAFLQKISNGQLGSGKTRISNTSKTTIRYNHTKSFWEIIDIGNASHMEAM